MAAIDLQRRIDGLDFSVVKEKDYNDALDFLFENFLQEEPLLKSRGGAKMRQPNMMGMCRDLLESGVSVACRDPANGDRMAGVLATSINTKSSAHPPTQSLSEYRDTYGECFGTAIYALTIYGGPAVLFAIRPDVDKCIDLEFLSVSRQYARRGIGGNLIKMALEAGKMAGCDVANVMCTSPFTARICCVKLGFTEYKLLVWKDISVGRETLFPNVEFPSAPCAYKIL